MYYRSTIYTHNDTMIYYRTLLTNKIIIYIYMWVYIYIFIYTYIYIYIYIYMYSI